MPPFNWPKPPPPPVAPNGKTTKLPADIDDLERELGGLTGRTLAMSDGHGNWMRPRVVPLVPNGRKPTVYLSVECSLVSYGRGGNVMTLVLEGECGTRGTLTLVFPPQGWLLHLVGAQPQVAQTASAQPSPPPAKQADPAPKPKPKLPPELVVPVDSEPESPQSSDDSARKKADDIFRSIFN